MATFNAGDWTPGTDEYHRQCWQNKLTGIRVYKFPPPQGLSADNGTGPNLLTATQFTAAEGLAAEAMWKQAVAGAWTVYHHDGKSYWYNTMSGDTTWDRPDTYPMPPPPPPPPPPVEPTPAKKPAPVNEKDQWKQERNGQGRKIWRNETTGETQYDTPDCLMKYRQHI